MHLSPDLVGFGVFDISGDIYCECYYSGQNLPSPPAGFEVFHQGTGPIGGSDGFQNTDCYAFAQVREVSTFSKPSTLISHFTTHLWPMLQGTGSPTVTTVTSAPSPAALAYNLVGVGWVRSPIHKSLLFIYKILYM